MRGWGGRGAEEGAATRAAPLAWAQWEESMAEAKAGASRVHPGRWQGGGVGGGEGGGEGGGDGKVEETGLG